MANGDGFYACGEAAGKLSTGKILIGGAFCIHASLIVKQPDGKTGNGFAHGVRKVGDGAVVRRNRSLTDDGTVAQDRDGMHIDAGAALKVAQKGSEFFAGDALVLGCDAGKEIGHALAVIAPAFSGDIGDAGRIIFPPDEEVIEQIKGFFLLQDIHSNLRQVENVPPHRAFCKETSVKKQTTGKDMRRREGEKQRIEEKDIENSGTFPRMH